MTEHTVTAYFDLEFCNERISRHNVPVAIGVSYRRGEEEIGTYYSLIWCGDDLELWQEQLDHIGYSKILLRNYGKPMEEVTEELMACHEKYQPKLYISFGKQDEDLMGLEELTPRQREKLHSHKAYLKKNRQLYQRYEKGF